MNVVTESKEIVTSFNVRKFLMRTDWIFIAGSSSLVPFAENRAANADSLPEREVSRRVVSYR